MFERSGAAQTTPATCWAWVVGDRFCRDLVRFSELVETKSNTNNEDIASVALDFAGRTLQTKRNTTTYAQTQGIYTKNTYYAAGQLKMTCQRIDLNGITGQTEPIGRYEYNDLGELTQKTQGCAQQVITYKTDLQGRLTNINDSADPANLLTNKKLFGLSLAYNLDNNITNQQWGSVPHFRQSPTLPATRGYAYTYDALSRLTAATFAGGANENFNLSNLSYDLNGNIKTLTRRVQTPTLGNNDTEDDLHYTYTANTNRLRNVFDAGSATPNNPKKNQYFTDRNPSTTLDDYTYDAAGNLTQDKNRDISNISYNALGLPEKITLPTGSIYYYYTGGGDKLRKKGAYLPSNPPAPSGGASITLVQVKLDYLAAGVYRDDTLTFIPTAEGRYIPPSPQAPGRIRFVGSYEYQQTDHLGNLRTACQCGIKLDVATSTLVPVLLTENPITLVQENHYDPWGVNLADIETTTALGFDWWQYNAQSEKSYLPDGSFDYDTDFRGYDPQIGRFKGVDALADALPGISTFQFGYNNPLSFQDPTGLISYTGGSSGGGGGWGGILGFGLNIAFNAIGNSLMQHTPTPRPVVQGNKMITPSDATHYNRPLVNGTPEPFNIQSVNVERAMKKRLPGEPIHYASGAIEPVYPETFAVPALATYRGLSGGVASQDLLQTSLSLSRFGSFGQGVEISTVLRAKQVSHIAAKGVRYTAGELGWYGEERLAIILGDAAAGKKALTTIATQKRRIFDNFKKEIGHESKVGRTPLDSRAREEIANTIQLIKEVQIKKSVWHFFRSPTTGAVGPTKGLERELNNANIKFVIHD